MSRLAVLGGAMMLLGVLVVVPLVVLAFALAADPQAGLHAVRHPLNLRAAWNTVLLAVGATSVTLVLGVPLGFLVGRSDLPRRNLWKAVCTLPYVVPPYLAAIAWITLLNPTNGLLNRVLVGAGLPALNIYSIWGMIWVEGLAFTPFIMLATADALGRMDASLEEQARIAGAGPLRTLLTVTLPVAMPGIAVGASFVIAAVAASFGVPYLLATGTASPDYVLTHSIYQALQLDPATGRPAAVSLSLLLLMVGVGLPLMSRLLQGSRRFTTVTGKATRVAPFELGRGRWLALGLVGLYVLVAVVLPMTTLGVASLMQNFGRGLTPENLTLANYGAVLFERSDTLPSLFRSLWLAVAAATAATLLGAVLAWMGRRTTTPGRGLATGLARLPYAVPGTVLALGLLLAFSQEVRVVVVERLMVGLALADTLWMLGLAYLVKFLAFPVGNADAGLQAVDPSLEEASRMSGAGFVTTLGKITLPLLRPNLLAAWFLVFIAAFAEVTMSILLVGPNTGVVGTLLFELQTYGDPPSAAVLAVVVTLLVLLAAGAMGLVGRGRTAT